MSSFVCPPTHFAALRSTLSYMVAQGGDRDRRAVHALLVELEYNEPRTFESAADLVNEWHEMNMDSVAIQYHENRDKVAECVMVQEAHRPGPVLDMGSLYNALRCLNYQIEPDGIQQMRGITPREKRALELLDAIRGNVAHILAETSDEMQHARYSWCIE